MQLRLHVPENDVADHRRRDRAAQQPIRQRRVVVALVLDNLVGPRALECTFNMRYECMSQCLHVGDSTGAAQRAWHSGRMKSVSSVSLILSRHLSAHSRT